MKAIVTLTGVGRYAPICIEQWRRVDSLRAHVWRGETCTSLKQLVEAVNAASEWQRRQTNVALGVHVVLLEVDAPAPAKPKPKPKAKQPKVEAEILKPEVFEKAEEPALVGAVESEGPLQNFLSNLKG